MQLLQQPSPEPLTMLGFLGSSSRWGHFELTFDSSYFGQQPKRVRRAPLFSQPKKTRKYIGKYSLYWSSETTNQKYNFAFKNLLSLADDTTTGCTPTPTPSPLENPPIWYQSTGSEEVSPVWGRKTMPPVSGGRISNLRSSWGGGSPSSLPSTVPNPPNTPSPITLVSKVLEKGCGHALRVLSRSPAGHPENVLEPETTKGHLALQEP